MKPPLEFDEHTHLCLTRSIGPWSGGTRVEYCGHVTNLTGSWGMEQDATKILVRRFQQINEQPFYVTKDDLVARRPKVPQEA